MDVATPLRQLTEISEYISQEMSTVVDQSLQNRTPIPFIFKMNGILHTTISHLEGVSKYPPLLECLDFQSCFKTVA